MSEKLVRITRNIFLSPFTELSGLDRRRSQFINAAAIVGIVTMFIFGRVNYLDGLYLVAYLEVACGFFVFFNLLWFRRYLNIKFTGAIVLSAVTALFLFLFYEGGIANTAILWFYAYPLVTFFLYGTRRGLYWQAFFIGGIVVMYALSEQGLFNLPFSYLVVRQFIASFFVVSLLVYIYQRLAEENELYINNRNKELVGLNQLLSNQIHETIEARDELDKKLGEIRIKNRQLEKTQSELSDALAALDLEKRKVEERVREKTAELSERLAEISAEKAKDEALFESIGEGLVAVDQKGIVTFANSRATALLGMKPGEMLGMSYPDICDIEGADGDKIPLKDRPVTRVLKTKKPFITTHDMPTIYVHRGSIRFPAYIVVTPILIEHKVAGAIVVFRDITADQEVDRAKNEFVSLASHQLRTPLTAIKGYTSMLLDKEVGKLNLKQKKYLTEIHQANERMIALINDLLNVSRIDLGIFTIEPEIVSLTAISDSCLGELFGIIKEKKIKITTKYDPAVPMMPADPKLVRIIFQNLVSNAIKYTPEGGHVDVEVTLKGSMVSIVVRDDGYGIPDQAKNKIFSKLYRADNAREFDPEGTGLGLYIVKSVVEESGGSIRFESKEGQGTFFEVLIPSSGMKHRDGTRGLA